MPSRRAFVTGSALVLLTVARSGESQPPERARLGILSPGTATRPTFQQPIAAFLARLREAGWEEGRNLVIERRFAAGDYERLPALARELVLAGVDVIFANSAPAAIAAKAATSSVPVVFETLGDALTGGLVQSLARPGGNVTGVSGLGPELSGKRLEILNELVPSLKRILVLMNPSNAMTPPALRETETAARRLGFNVQVIAASDVESLERGLAGLPSDRSSALVVLPDVFVLSHARAVIAALEKRRLPAVFLEDGWIDAGGLIAYSPSLVEQFRRAATFVDRILRGARPADLPIEQPTTFDLTVNRKAARAIGLTLPPSILLRASRVIE